ncbi:hypothetical protein [Sphingobacterium wenxiniae]|uniref:YfcL protein n=1 Tax=Sphingobacterium wenxiniae TaxID=683125 RepID=A0A1I6Q501_9SPHI|nr:hypothetical protein [Sphingobacterium wenxiniae]SFS47527.1 hypothetical protein SAMN05660206_102125 [Sphingobacterium wenxiniae]
MTTQQQEMIIGDFEKYMRHAIGQPQPFTLEGFVAFAISLVNFYEGSNLIANNERAATAELLLKSFNAGLKNSITAADQKEIIELIISDFSLDYSILSPIFA